LTNDNFLAWSAPGIGRSLFFMGLQGILFFLGLYFLESNVIQKIVQRLGARESEVKLVVAIGDDPAQQVRVSWQKNY
jgi:hypothetical protein